jgi:hypothetical protein
MAVFVPGSPECLQTVMVVFEITKQVLGISEYARVDIQVRIDKQRILAGDTDHLLFPLVLPDEKIVSKFVRCGCG